MLKELHTIKLIGDYLRENRAIQINNINHIYDFFTYLNQNKYSFNSLYIFNYLYNFISCDEVSKRKTSARVFEDMLAILFDGVVSDTKHRKNLHYNVPDYFNNVKDKIASNRREKTDIIFDNRYSFSIKTLMKDNQEINMGSFEKSVLFDSLNVDNYLSERTSNTGAGLGSKAQLLKLFNIIETLSSWDSFKDKFNHMVRFIYADDLLIAIKDNIVLELYFLSGNELILIFENFSVNKDELLKIINRYEGNSLRIDRKMLLRKCSKKLVLDFSYLDSTIIKQINEFDLKLHKNYANYFNQNNKTEYKQEMIQNLQNLFNEFEKYSNGNDR